ncbi:MAG: hypothetical protein L0312_18380, partial [Acidobacteria bacterium]|nr:hypothetical protein [Acidobacteriota bacterium]
HQASLSGTRPQSALESLARGSALRDRFRLRAASSLFGWFQEGDKLATAMIAPNLAMQSVANQCRHIKLTVPRQYS